MFKKLNFKRYIERFSLQPGESNNSEQGKDEIENLKIIDKSLDEIIELVKNQKQMIFYLDTKTDENPEKIIKEKISSIAIYDNKNKEAIFYNFSEETEIQALKEILENNEIKKIGINLTKTYILLKQVDITLDGIYYDISIASYILNPSNNKLEIENLIDRFLEIDTSKLASKEETTQINLFDEIPSVEQDKEKCSKYSYAISKIKDITEKKLEEIDALKLFNEIDMPTVEVLSDMQWNGM